MRVMLDTNVLVSAFWTRGVCADVLAAVLTDHEFVVAHQTTLELEHVLVEKMAVPATRAREIVAFIADKAEVVESTRPAAWPLRDPDDRWIVAAALDHGIDMLVTGDKDILDDPQTALKAIRPGAFLDLLQGHTA